METELNLEHLLNIIDPYINDGTLDCIDIGELDGTPFIVIDDHNTLAFINGAINGFIGAVDRPYVGTLELPEAITATIKELELSKQNNPDHLGTHNNLESKISALRTCILYDQHLTTIEDPIDLDDFDLEWGFNDEYSRCACGNCSNIVRTSPDCYEWIAPLFIDCEGYISDDCVDCGNFDDYILDEYKNTNKALPSARSTDDLGLAKVNTESFQNGWYGGQCDTPAPIIESLNSKDIDVWFKVYPRQFDMDFDVYVKEKDLERASYILSNTNTETDIDPATLLKQGLEAASAAMSKLPNDSGIKHATIDTDSGTATARIVTPAEFVKGIK